MSKKIKIEIKVVKRYLQIEWTIILMNESNPHRFGAIDL